MNPPVHLDARVVVTVSKIKADLPNWYRVIEILEQFERMTGGGATIRRENSLLTGAIIGSLLVTVL
jgi:hypothetical protein